MSFEVELYTTDNGKVPFKEFVKTLDDKMKAKLTRDLELLETFGNNLRRPYSALVRDGIFELRTQNNSNIIRSFYFFYVGNRIVITHGFSKKQQKTPQKELDKAMEYRKDWLRRNK